MEILTYRPFRAIVEKIGGAILLVWYPFYFVGKVIASCVFAMFVVIVSAGYLIIVMIPWWMCGKTVHYTVHRPEGDYVTEYKRFTKVAWYCVLKHPPYPPVE